MREALRDPARAATASPDDPTYTLGTRLKTKVWLERDGRFVIGDGGLRLLLGILEHGSLLGSARQIGWSYRHAWGYLRRAEEALGAPLTHARPGKGASRGMGLTEIGRQLIEDLAGVRNRIDDAVGPSAPTAQDIARRGRRQLDPGPSPPSRAAGRRGDSRSRR
jgi:molybdate transport system regulatory protein